MTLPIELIVNLLDEDDPGAPGLVDEIVTNVLFGVSAGGNVNSRLTRFGEQGEERFEEGGVRAVEMQQI